MGAGVRGWGVGGSCKGASCKPKDSSAVAVMEGRCYLLSGRGCGGAVQQQQEGPRVNVL